MFPRRSENRGAPGLKLETRGTRTTLSQTTTISRTTLSRTNLFRAALCASLALSAVLGAVFSIHWPLVGDASLIHYIAFLIERGWAPYRELGDMNLPGSFLIELAAMHLFGPGALAWRIFDLTLCLASSAAFFAICNPASITRSIPAGRSLTPSPHPSEQVGKRTPARIRLWLPVLFASALFFLIHTRDGLAQGGQRDLTMAVTLVASTAFLQSTIHRPSLTSAAAFGLLSGLAATIKPTALVLSVAQLLVALQYIRRTSPNRRQRFRAVSNLLTAAAIAWLLAPALCLVFLIREHAFGAFLQGLRTVVPYYASLGHRPLAYVLQHSVSPLLPLVVLWLALLLLRKPTQRGRLDLRHMLLLTGVLFGVLNCLIQARALPYYRYPLLAFLLPLIALDLTSAAESVSPATAEEPHHMPSAAGERAPSTLIYLTRVVAFCALTFGSLFLAPQSAVLIQRYRWQQTDMLDSLQHSLEALGGPALSRHIQCIDSVSGCNTVLNRMRLEPSTGILSDFLLFGNSTDRNRPEAIPVIRDTRAAFFNVLRARAPEVIVITSHLHMTGPEDFGKLARWPAFGQFLTDHYTLATEWHPARTERWWSREELPAAYRIYTLRR